MEEGGSKEMEGVWSRQDEVGSRERVGGASRGRGEGRSMGKEGVGWT